MEHKAKSIRPFIGSKNFEISRHFYQDLGFKEIILGPNFSYFETKGIGFYLQDYYMKDWIDNTMLFLEVENVDQFWTKLLELDLSAKYENIKLVPSVKWIGERNVLSTILLGFCGMLGSFINKNT